MVVEEGGDDRVRWGTWEELILGGAVLRHGCQDWGIVAKEVQTRTLHPYLFTPQVCKSKYEALQERYSGCSAWFEELKKRRVEELRRALEKSDDSIGSLETKLVSLKAEKAICNHSGYNSSQEESPVQFFKLAFNESSSKEASKDGSSAGSFTHETQANWLQQCHLDTKASVEEAEIKPIVLAPSRLERFPSIDELAETMRSEHGVSIKGRRGKRRRKDLSKNVKEGSVGENNFILPAVIMTTSQGSEKLTSYSVQPTRAPDTNNHYLNTSKQGTDDFKKKRKHPSKATREGSAGKNYSLSSASVLTTSQGKEKLTRYSGQPVVVLGDHNPSTSKQGINNVTKKRRKELKKGGSDGKMFVSSADKITASHGMENLTTKYNQLMRAPDANYQIPSTIKREDVSFTKKRREILSKDVVEGAVEENKLISSTDITTTSGQPLRVPNADDPTPCTSEQGADDFIKIFDSVLENEHASVFRRRLDSQKRARYRGIVRQHMDLDTIRSRINNKSIKSTVELLRDLLLIANNALVFYSRITREYRCALVLRDLVSKRLNQYCRAGGTKTATAQSQKSPVRKPPAKPRSARPFNRKLGNNEANGGSITVIIAPKEVQCVSSNFGSPSSAESSALTKKSSGRRGKVWRVKRSNTGIQAETPMKVRKKGKVK